MEWSRHSGRHRLGFVRIYDLFRNLKARRQNRAGRLSGGERQMLAVGRALMTNPRVDA